jgi:hypothetical protein
MDDDNRNRKNYDFEPSRAKNTSEVPASMMGFTPHRTALKPSDLPIPKKELNEVVAQKEKVNQSIEAGKKVAEIYRDINNKKHEEYLKDANDNSKWQDHAANKIKRNYEKEISSKNDAFNFGNPNEYRETSYDKDLSSIFKKSDPLEERDIKRGSENIKDNTRKHRSEDRSWENVESSKKKKI